MDIICKEIIIFLEDVAPLEIAEEWDNVGLLIGSKNNKINRIMVCLDITKKVVEDAINKRINLIISHHPLIFKGIKKILEDDVKGQIIHSLIKNNINVYCAHTNLDFAEGGINDYLAEVLELNNIRNINNNKLGKIGKLKAPLSLSEFVNLVKTNLGINNLKLIGNIEKDIQDVGVFCGSFDESLIEQLKYKCDILVTGDIKYHAALNISENGLCIIDAGHYYTEKIFIPELHKILKEKFSNLEIFISSAQTDPFNCI